MNRLKLVWHFSFTASKAWKRFKEDDCQDNSKFIKIIESSVGGSDLIMNKGNLSSNIILLELARNKNYEVAFDAWNDIPNPLELGDEPNREIEMYMAAALCEIGKKTEALKITIDFKSQDTKDLTEQVVKYFESGKGFALSWAKSCKQALELTADTKLLEGLVIDKDESVRSQVAENYNTPVELLEVLAKDNDEEVRSAVAENQNTPVELLEVLVKDKQVGVRGSVAKNKNTPKWVLEDLAKDKEVSQYLSEQTEMADYLRSVFRGSE